MLQESDYPSRSGVYLFKSQHNKVLYVGKATNLRNRIRQYFQRKGDPRIADLLERAAHIDYVVTDDARDALLLEFNLIQRYQPPFNIRLKDDRSFPWVVLTEHDFPALLLRRELRAARDRFGPLLSLSQGKPLMDLLYRNFRLRQCRDTVFRKGKSCIYHHIDRCSAPCEGLVTREEYLRQAEAAARFLRGDRSELRAALRERMWREAGNQNFEAAEVLRQDLELLEGLRLESGVYLPGARDFDLLLVHQAAGMIWAHYQQYRDEKLKDSGYLSSQSLRDDFGESLREFFSTFYRARSMPARIFSNAGSARSAEVAAELLLLFGKKTAIRPGPPSGKRDLWESALANLGYFVLRSDFGPVARELGALVGRESVSTVEALDISHFGERERVGAIVRYESGRPLRSGFRNYLLRAAAPGDTRAIEEVLRRRFARSNLPELLLLDGGRGQLATARALKAELGLELELLALAKREERIFLENGRELVLPPESSLRLFLQRVRDEVHRRAISYHRFKRGTRAP